MSASEDQTVISIGIEDEMKRSYMDYAMSVIVSRAIPDVRDGLKPVHRRILYSMYESGFYANKPYKKSARIVGDVIGKYHPHGDTAVYDSLVRMAQDFSLRVPLIDGQGNFGSMDGDSAAAMRYTESRLAKISHTLLEDIDKETVDFQANYDGSESEPKVIPAMFPNLLVNGTGGIAVGMATNIPPHNLGEIIDACVLYIDNNNIDISELISVVKGPDFPTGGIILGSSGIQSAYLTGRGSVVFRGKCEIEDNNNRQAIIISEMPYMVNKAKLVEKIADLVHEKKIEGISDLRDESNKDGVRVVIEIKRDAVAEVVLNQLYSFTQLQTSFGVIMLALDEGMPKVMNLKEVISAFVKFREVVITRRTIFLLNKARDKAHILLGIRIAVSNIDEIIRIIKSASNPNDAKDQLMEKSWSCSDIANLIKLVDDKAIIGADGKIHLTEAQAKAILEMRLQRLTAMEKDKLEADLTELSKEITEYIDILSSREKLLSILKSELLKVREDYATPRLTEIIQSDFEYDMEDLIQKEDMVVTVTLSGYIKRVPLATYRAQKRGGKGRSGLSMRDEDILTQLFVGNTHTPMLFFSNMGQVYSLKLYKLPLGNPQSKGRPIVNLLPLKEGEVITNIMPMPENQEEWDNMHIMFATSKGNIRRNDLSDFKKIQANGKIAIRLDEDDSLVNVMACSEDDHILLASRQGKAVRFPVNAVRVFRSRTSDGVRGMKLADGDKVISMTILHGIKASMEEREAYLTIPVEKRLEIAKGDQEFTEEELGVSLSKEQIIELAKAEEFILTISENGFGKRTSAYHYRITNRGGSGIVNMVLSAKTGDVVASMPANTNDEIMLITNNGKLIRCKLDSVRITGRSTSGVILFKTEKDERVVSASLIAEVSEEEAQVEEDIESESGSE
ncbi:MAG TPA: DNA topoisomerase (ATP-hydrolyzing) subunit A [Candidatus Megaira endosymbiont of Stentor roeselii]|nr:MAG: DNA topoisomerase (ATP-hydrolyzing) subunit A [Candidatus Megaira endosymbiont of Mesostigma viride]HJK85962.1 DNA topoisomerase (ATP-hydrolyzing) subunit A [Candidatus Megaera endosymbiont of Stentor roeselii]HJK88805.1 DNA topoisomerase (ATP-hydrolyzing) subunit A [Candidatus Megaira endosymbiont of Mesostigma viride]